MPQTKLIRLVRRDPALAPEAFQKRWLETHAPLVQDLPGVRRYVQSHALLQGYVKGPLIYDGVDEFWFDSETAMNAARDSAEWIALYRDLLAFASDCVVMPVEVHVIKDNPIPEPAVKNIEFVNRRPGMELDAFRRYWRETHGPIASHIPALVRYEQNHLALDEYQRGEPPFDGLAITWFRSTGDMRDGAKTPEYAATRADEPNFLPNGHLPIVIVREHVLI